MSQSLDMDNYVLQYEDLEIRQKLNFSFKISKIYKVNSISIIGRPMSQIIDCIMKQ